MAAILGILTSIFTVVWSILSPIKYYVIVAILAIVVWQKCVVDQQIFVDEPWDATVSIVAVHSPTELTVNHVSTNPLNRKRTLIVQGILVDTATLSKLLSVGTKVIVHVTDGNKLGAGQLTGIVDISGGTE